MLKVKRDLPPVMLDAEKRIEQWRSSLLASVHPRRDVAIYLLIRATCYTMPYKTYQLMPNDVSKLEQLVRDKLFGLQFALSGLSGDLPEGKFMEDQVINLISEEHLIRAREAVNYMSIYAHMRDAFLTYTWGGYEVANPNENVLRFVDPPGWMGKRDRAQQVISQEIKEDTARFLMSSPSLSVQQALEKSVEVPESLSLGDLTAAQFVDAWAALVREFAQHWLKGCSPVVEQKYITIVLQREANFSASEAERFVSLVTFDRKGSHALTLFHCPLVILTTHSLIAVPPGFIFGNPNVCIPKLAVHRGPGIDAFAKEVEARLLDKLRDHFHAKGVTINTCILYSWQSGSGDIDLVIYEAVSNRLLIGQVKAFVSPDTVEEVVRANQALEEGLQQVGRVRRWLDSLNMNSWVAALRVPLLSRPPKVHFAVIGNGFAGSDYLPIPQDVAVVDAHYLLLSRFAGASIFDTIDKYQKRLLDESEKAIGEADFNSCEVAGVTIEIPSWSITI